ncbi:hypothetical protein B0H13DRAFT_2384532 [Mycena leptocephala]|nr:hypothetical protein B0H13DRAFT_2384532 [Mycena leptocephala]
MKSLNCQQQFPCAQYGLCNKQGECECPAGWGGIDCLIPQCDSLADGDQRRLREKGKSCECKEGWGGINCNVCKTDQACAGFPPGVPPPGGGGKVPRDMVCYKGGETVFSIHQMCNVTNRGIVEVAGRPVQVTSSCDATSKTCLFQLWAAEVESFYCALDQCSFKTTSSYEANSTTYACEQMKCSCVPGRFICGENGSVDITAFLREEVRGPASLTCGTGSGCKFEEPMINELINDIFGDPYITMDCESGQCLSSKEVPGYSPSSDNAWVLHPADNQQVPIMKV